MIKVTEGHLTQTEKKNILLILNAGLTEGIVGLKTYRLKKEDDVYTVKITQKDRGLIPCPGSKLRVSEYTHQFILV